MIEINLMPTKKGVGELQDLLSKISVPGVIFAIAFFIIPEMVYLSIVDGELQAYRTEKLRLDSEFRKISTRVRELKKIEEQIEALKNLEIKLAGRLEVVKKIISNRQNPFGMLYYLARNCPDELWLTEIEVKNNELIIRGFADTWKYIGNFLENLKNSIFFGKNIQYEQPKIPGDKYDLWKRKEYFQIKAQIVRFE